MTYIEVLGGDTRPVLINPSDITAIVPTDRDGCVMIWLTGGNVVHVMMDYEEVRKRLHHVTSINRWYVER